MAVPLSLMRRMFLVGGLLGLTAIKSVRPLSGTTETKPLVADWLFPSTAGTPLSDRDLINRHVYPVSVSAILKGSQFRRFGASQASPVLVPAYTRA